MFSVEVFGKQCSLVETWSFNKYLKISNPQNFVSSRVSHPMLYDVSKYL